MRYYASPAIIFAHMVLVIVPGIGVFAFIGSGHPFAILLGVLLLVIAVTPLYVKIRYPILEVVDLSIHKRDIVGRKIKISDLREYSLVISSDFLAFRQAGKNDIMIEKKWFSKERWGGMVADLKLLPFK